MNVSRSHNQWCSHPLFAVLVDIIIVKKKLNSIGDRADKFQEQKNTIYSLLVQPYLSQFFGYLKWPNG
jgi:hypothetical protein